MCARSEWPSPTRASEYDSVQQNPFGDQPEYRKKSPLQKIPCWEEGDLILPDSSVILSYLESRYPEPPLLPADPGKRARALWFEEYGDTKVAETLALVFFQRVVRPNVLKQDPDQKVIDYALTKSLPEAFDYLTKCLGDDEFMVGGAFSLADIALTTPFVNFAMAGEKVDSARWPKIAAYVERIHGLPCYAPIVAEHVPGRK